jgi:hypothetical protein
MSNVIRKGVVVAASAAVALGGIAAPAGAANKGHHTKWSKSKCEAYAKQWGKSHKHPTQKQENHFNKVLKKHSCD